VLYNSTLGRIVLGHHPILPLVVVAVAMLLLIVSFVSFKRLCEALTESDIWRSRFEKSPSWFAINGLTTFEWRVWWALMSGRLATSESQGVRQLARLSRRCFFIALILILASVVFIELGAPVTFLSTLF